MCAVVGAWVGIAYLVLLLIFAEVLNKLKYLKIFRELSLIDFEPWGRCVLSL